MSSSLIRFYKGEETGPIVETQGFDSSLFYQQYKQAIDFISEIANFQKTEKDRSNVIAFCGDRGEGKTSCLETVAGMLKNVEAIEKSSYLYDKLKIYKDDFFVIDTIDPSFFNPAHNLIDLLIGQMYSQLIKGMDYREDLDSQITCRTKVLQQFAKVKKSLKIINHITEGSIYDELEETDNLAAAVNLRNELNGLFDEFLDFFNKKKLLICIDDLDLNMKCGYRMAEEIRNYLSPSSRCILFIALKVDQLEEIIKSEYRASINGIVIDEHISEMAERYVAKLIPLSQRVLMPTGYEIAEREIELNDSHDKDAEKRSYNSVKEAVVRLIFEKTRYIFVNSPNLSPVVPTNLRNLRHLIGLLWDMPKAKNDDGTDNIENKRAFKQFFFKTWTKCLKKEDYDFAQDISNREEPISINKSVVLHLRNRFKDIINSEASNTAKTDDIVTKIFEPKNMEFNISLGDVFYCMRYLEHIILDTNAKNLLFFLRSFYSIKMYDIYNHITKDEKTLFPDDNGQTTVTLYKYDRWLQRQNQLQRLLNGSYFTYEAGDLIATEKNANNKPRDRRPIDASALRDVFNQVKQISQTGFTNDADILNLNLCEFFALTTCRPDKDLYGRGVDREMNRTNPNAPYIQPYTSDNNYLVFDVMSIFYNVINIKQTYDRMNGFITANEGDPEIKFYDTASKCDGSILNKMKKECKKGEDYKNGTTLDKDLHGFISEATIRISEVQMGILDTLYDSRFQKNNRSSSSNIEKIRKLYEEIQDTGLQLYSLNDNNDLGYPLQFRFLKPIINFLNSTNKDPFEKIFSSEKSRTDTMSITDILDKIYTNPHSAFLRKKIIQKLHEMGIGESSFWGDIFVEETKYSRKKCSETLEDHHDKLVENGIITK